ncbi:hypothetical protein J132_06851 [Termitomyces sp. J132]|nr:hypothetical protein J132_06851 [Termitomyces sp. J132]
MRHDLNILNDNSGPRYPLGPGTHQAPVIPCPALTPPPINREASAYPAIYLPLRITQDLLGPLSLGAPRKLSPPPLQLRTPGYKRRTSHPPTHTGKFLRPILPGSLCRPIRALFPPRPPFAAQTPPSPRQQRIEAYAQQCDEVLHFLRLSPAEFARRTRTLLTNLGYPDTSATPEVWADRLLDFHKRYLQGNLPENTQGTLGLNDNLRNELRALVKEIHTSPNPCPFEDPLDPARSFHVQCEEPIGTQNKAPSSVPRQQEELNAASSILRNLNPVGGLFDQPAAHTLAGPLRPALGQLSAQRLPNLGPTRRP